MAKNCRKKLRCRNPNPPKPQGAARLPEWLRMVLCLFTRGPQASQSRGATLNIAMELVHEPMGRCASSSISCAAAWKWCRAERERAPQQHPKGAV